MLKKTFIGLLLCLDFTVVFGDEIMLSVKNMDKNGNVCVASPGTKCGNGCAKLTWNHCDADTYTIFRSLDQGANWDFIATVSSTAENMEYIDSLRDCEVEVSYQIRVSNAGGTCTNSAIVTEMIVDKEEPAHVEIDAISVDAQTHQIQIVWSPCPSPDAYGYVVSEAQPSGGAIVLDTIFGVHNNIYTVKKTPDTLWRFQISAIDSCYNRSLLSGIKQAFTCDLTYQQCEKQILVSWSDARKSMENIARFDIMVSKNEGNFTLYKSLDAAQNSAIVETEGDSVRYKIYVRATNANETVFANSISDTAFVVMPPEPEFYDLRTLNVLDDETLEMRVYVDAQTIWENLFIYTSNNTLVKTLSYEDFLKTSQSIILPYQNTDYHFEISNICDEKNAVSISAKPIRLEAKLNGEIIDLTFSTYQGWEGTVVRRYHVIVVETGDTLMQEWVDGQTFSVTRQLPIKNPEQILALNIFVLGYEEEVSNPYVTTETAKSNVVELIAQKSVLVFFPTGFFPAGKSQFYYPIFSPHDGDVMEFEILNKFGQPVFSTQTPRNGWDGTFKGKEQPPGVYLYLFRLTRKGVTTEEKGCFTLIR